MRDLTAITRSLSLLGEYLLQHGTGDQSDNEVVLKLNELHFSSIEDAISKEFFHNPWFTEQNVRTAIGSLAAELTGKNLSQWFSMYPNLNNVTDQKTVGVVMAGNIPLVGFHDLLCVLISGHKFIGKTSSKDDRLIRLVTTVLSSIDPKLAENVDYTENYLNNADAIIATGSNNSARYFEYYFRNIPHIIRKNRNGVAILTGNESLNDLLKLGDDIFSYFGLGCRNITKVYLPKEMKPEQLLEAFEKFEFLSGHNKYCNNLDYNRSVYMMNRIPFLDNGVVLFKEDENIASPVGVVYYQKYSQLDSLVDHLKEREEEIQCLVTRAEIPGAVRPGESQSPKLWEYADNVDTLEFLLSLSYQDDI